MNKINKLLNILNLNSFVVILPNWRSYVRYPIWDWIIYPELYNLVTAIILEKLNYIDPFDFIVVGEEDIWWHIVPLVAHELNKPYCLMRWGTQWLKWDISIPFQNLYTNWILNINDLKRWDNVVIVEDMIDTWWTMISMIDALKLNNITIKDVIAVCNRLEKEWIRKIFEKTGITPKVLMNVLTNGDQFEFVAV